MVKSKVKICYRTAVENLLNIFATEKKNNVWEKNIYFFIG